MDSGAVRARVLLSNLAAHGVDITVTRPYPDDDPIATRGIWLTFSSEDVPGRSEFSRRDPKRIMALSLVDVPTVPRGTLIIAPPKAGDANQAWRVDGEDRREADHVRVIVVPSPDDLDEDAAEAS